MPIRADQRRLYPANWRTLSLQARHRAGWRCETCGVEDGAWGWRDAEGAFHAVDQEQVMLEQPDRRPPFHLHWQELPDVVRVIEIVLTVGHLDHDPTHNDPSNLRAMCQRCHLNNDRPHHRRLRGTRQHDAMETHDLPLEAAGGAAP